MIEIIRLLGGLNGYERRAVVGFVRRELDAADWRSSVRALPDRNGRGPWLLRRLCRARATGPTRRSEPQSPLLRSVGRLEGWLHRHRPVHGRSPPHRGNSLPMRPCLIVSLLLAACSSTHDPTDAGSGMDAAVDARVDAAEATDAGTDAALLPIRDGDVRCESTECRDVAGTCCPRPDGTWFCCGGTSSCDYDAGMCECFGREPCPIRLYCCGSNDAGIPLGECVGFDTYNRSCDPGHMPPG